MFQGPSVFGIHSLNVEGVQFLDFIHFFRVILDLEILPCDEFTLPDIAPSKSISFSQGAICWLPGGHQHEKSTILGWYRDFGFMSFFSNHPTCSGGCIKILNNEAIG